MFGQFGGSFTECMSTFPYQLLVIGLISLFAVQSAPIVRVALEPQDPCKLYFPLERNSALEY